jgi:hypothetical protein
VTVTPNARSIRSNPAALVSSTGLRPLGRTTCRDPHKTVHAPMDAPCAIQKREDSLQRGDAGSNVWPRVMANSQTRDLAEPDRRLPLRQTLTNPWPVTGSVPFTTNRKGPSAD